MHREGLNQIFWCANKNDDRDYSGDWDSMGQVVKRSASCLDVWMDIVLFSKYHNKQKGDIWKKETEINGLSLTSWVRRQYNRWLRCNRCVRSKLNEP